MRALAVGLAAAMLPLAAAADEVFLKSGGQLSGRIVSRTADMIEVDVGAGRIAVSTSSVVRIEEGRSALHAYEERAGRLPAGDVEGWIALGDWASSAGLGSQAREAYHRALSASPHDARANTALGNVQVGGRWVGEDEAILRERAAEAEQERGRQAEARVQEAEARAQEAEARARGAEAKAAEAQGSSEGLPLWYGWGAGPVSWSTGSISMQPIVTPRPGVPR